MFLYCNAIAGDRADLGRMFHAEERILVFRAPHSPRSPREISFSFACGSAALGYLRFFAASQKVRCALDAIGPTLWFIRCIGTEKSGGELARSFKRVVWSSRGDQEHRFVQSLKRSASVFRPICRKEDGALGFVAGASKVRFDFVPRRIGF